MSKTPEIRPANKADVLAFQDHVYRESFRGLTVRLDDEIVGICGILHSQPHQAFSVITDELRQHPKAIMKASRLFKDMLNRYEQAIYAIASDKERNATGFLEHLGFNHVEGKVYQWPIQ